jgi:vibriolysin
MSTEPQRITTRRTLWVGEVSFKEACATQSGSMSIILMVNLALLAGTSACDVSSDSETAPTGADFGEMTSETGEIEFDPNRRVVENPGEGLDRSRMGDSGPVESSESALVVTDGSQTIHTRIFQCNSGTAQSHPQVVCSVDPDYVVIGGGAWAYGTGAGGFLTASAPYNSALGAWYASSKDHDIADPHILYVWAVGLKLDGISADILRQNMTLVWSTSPRANWPDQSVSLPAGYLLVGGGAIVNWSGWGNLLVASRPLGTPSWGGTPPTAWYGRSKDHLHSSPATITVLAIGIRPTIPGFGTLQVAWRYPNVSYAPSGVGSASGSVEGSWALACLGGESSWNGYGRMLFRMSPVDSYSNTSLTVASKDLRNSDSGFTSLYYTEVRRAP